MLRRAVRFADAIVVPTHAMAADLAELASLDGRVRVIAGAPPEGFRVPIDAVARARTLALPHLYVAVLGRVVDPDALGLALTAAAESELDVVVLGLDEGDGPRLAEIAHAARMPGGRVHAPRPVDALDRAAILAGAVAVLAPSVASAYPWRLLEALSVGAPIIAARTLQNEELLADGAQLTAPGDSDELGELLLRVTDEESFAKRLRVLAADRSRAFSWRDAADRVWQLHAEL
jgi:glycosyltransferase involved in cell wall biosynthesis